MEFDDESRELDEWKNLFDPKLVPRRDLGELARILAARLLLGANVPESVDEDGKMVYSLKRPIRGHGAVFVDVLYGDDNMKILRGHHGSLFVFIRSLS